ncbi:hypothetical protein [Microbacterium ulmi]|uniref:Uncharacterized protein n=1 Tax=Microbacterium ulmi TaxID=179095 RepID=A0A7Y2M387_9MICO|nr:hypothetical protein [Microbacterium ulmi]NII70558.1 hypothetical protein [Microbacterium ulmi]NNH05224.1 hypothetical protein [Microbacterium ulmi]
MSDVTHRARARRVLGALMAVGLATLALSACRPEPAASPTSTPSSVSTPTPTLTPTDPGPTPEPTVLGPDDIALPTSCESIYSPAMRDTLEAQLPPLNDPGVTMNSSQIVEALELLTSGIPTIRCSWGTPSESGLATNVSLIEQDRAQELIVSLQSVGFICDSVDDGTMCDLQRNTIDLDDNEVALGESHYFRGNGWVSTAWIQSFPEGYTDDIVATLWQ